MHPFSRMYDGEFLNRALSQHITVPALMLLPPFSGDQFGAARAGLPLGPGRPWWGDLPPGLGRRRRPARPPDHVGPGEQAAARIGHARHHDPHPRAGEHPQGREERGSKPDLAP